MTPIVDARPEAARQRLDEGIGEPDRANCLGHGYNREGALHDLGSA